MLPKMTVKLMKGDINIHAVNSLTGCPAGKCCSLESYFIINVIEIKGVQLLTVKTVPRGSNNDYYPYIHILEPLDPLEPLELKLGMASVIPTFSSFAHTNQNQFPLRDIVFML